tara:strand:- start:199 stop:474 length:276 start_codon:yes stop_codon:yes gene_type:complete
LVILDQDLEQLQLDGSLVVAVAVVDQHLVDHLVVVMEGLDLLEVVILMLVLDLEEDQIVDYQKMPSKILDLVVVVFGVELLELVADLVVQV